MAHNRPPLIDLTPSSNIQRLPVTADKSSSLKRKADEPASIEFGYDSDGAEDEFGYDMTMDKSANQVRGMINRFLDSGEMKKGEFAKAIRVSPNSLNGFLRTSGTMGGAGSASYFEAWRFFKRRELAGIKAPKKAKTTASKATVALPDTSKVHLDGEEERKVEVYDTCDEIRRKINAHLVKSGITQAQFCRDIAAQLHDESKIQSKQLADFRGKKGASAGNSSKVFYAAYVYFEKQRIAENKPKSKHRQDMEATWMRNGGFDTTANHSKGYFCFGNERPHEDKLGLVYCS